MRTLLTQAPDPNEPVDLTNSGFVTGSGSTSTGSDHYPIVGDYVVVPPPIVLIPQGFGTNGYFQVTLTSMADNCAKYLENAYGTSSGTDCQPGSLAAEALTPHWVGSS